MTTHEMLCRFKPDMRVLVTKQNSYNSKKYLDIVTSAYGTVIRVDTFYERVHVMIDGHVNELSNNGSFRFKPHELEILDENNNVMEGDNMSTITNYLNAVKIQYVDNDKPSSYAYANFDTSLAVGDLCVIQSAHHGLGLAKVTEIIDKNDVELAREVVAKVDLTEFTERVNIRNQAAQLKAMMEYRAKQLQDIALYQMLAEKDSEMQDLLNRYQSMPKM